MQDPRISKMKDATQQMQAELEDETAGREHETEIKGLQKDRKIEELREYVRDNPESAMIKSANAVELEVQKLRQMKREMVAANAPRERIKAMEDRINAKMTQFNEAVSRLKTRSTQAAQ